jgi:hypothetical protein
MAPFTATSMCPRSSIATLLARLRKPAFMMKMCAAISVPFTLKRRILRIEMFVLTKEEKRVVCFVLLALLIGLGVKEYRQAHPRQSSDPAGVKHASQASSNPKLMQERTASAQQGDSQVNR